MNFPSHIIVGALCYVVRGGEEVLLLRRVRPPHVGLWSAPGGKMEHTESPLENVTREIEEETGLRITNPRLIAIQTSVDVSYPVHWLLFVYRADEFSGTLLLPDTSEGELRWFPLAELPHIPRPHLDTLYMDYLTGAQQGVWQGKVVYDTPDVLVEQTIYPMN